MKKIFNILWGISIVVLSAISCTFAYSQEQQEAYQWAYKYGITTQPTIEDAKMDSPLTRQAFSKMVVNYLENVVWIEQSTSNSCYFPDENKITNGLVPYAKKACAYEIMWSNGKNFKPTDTIDRAQLWTVFSRILWWNLYDVGWKWYYIYHVNALQTAWIMHNIKNVVWVSAKRWDVMIMFKRMYEKFGSNIYLNSWNSSVSNNTGNIKTDNMDNIDNLIERLEEQDIYLEWDIIYHDNGEWESYYENGQLEAKGVYKDWALNGEFLTYYENGQPQVKCSFINGNLDGEFLLYYENGQLKEKDIYKNGEPDWEFVTYYENGQLRLKWNYKDGEPDWEFVTYYENGQLEEKWNVKDGNFDGELLLYYENGQLRSKQNYKNGVLDGEFLTYYENGQLQLKWNYSDGKPDWEFVTYYENGQIELVCERSYWEDIWKCDVYDENWEKIN